MGAEEIRYKAVSVRELLIEINNTIELMVDLAYSAVLFNDLELAEEVIEFDDRVAYLRSLLHMNLALAVKDRRDAEASVGFFRLTLAADKIANAARDIANTVILGMSVGEDVIGALSKVEERLIRTKIAHESILLGKTPRGLRLQTKIGIDLIAMRRGKELIIDPSGSERFGVGDVIIARGSDVGTSELDKLAKGELRAVPEPTVR